MNPIGGYFGLELRYGKEYHSKAISLNTGRNALEYILTTRNYNKVYIPYYTCESVVEPFKKLGISYEFYSLNNNLEPVFDYNKLNANSGFLYTNYFGIKDIFIKNLSKLIKNLIIDNAQSFFSDPIHGNDTFYSARKFFGIPDGAYLYTDKFLPIELLKDQSLERISHLVKRIEFGPTAGYEDFKSNDNKLIGQPIKKMSTLTKSLLQSIDYKFVKQRRLYNFSILDKALSKSNNLTIKLGYNSVPMLYPLLINKTRLKQKLIENKIFVPTYWPNVLKWSAKNSQDYTFAKNIIALPIDQRYNIGDMKSIINFIEKEK